MLNHYFVSSMAVQGVDISKYQGDVDFEALAASGIEFVYMKATEGSGYVDDRFEENWEAARGTSLAVGAYHFFSFESSGATQAEIYIETVGDLTGCLIPVVDVEYYGDMLTNPPDKETLLSELSELLNTLEDYYGVKPMIYTSRAMYQDYLKGSVEEYPLWVRSVYYPPIIDGWSNWTIWQYSDQGCIDCYSTQSEVSIDLDVLNTNVTLEDLIIP